MTFVTCNYDTSETGMKANYDGGYDFRFCYDSGYKPDRTTDKTLIGLLFKTMNINRRQK